MRNRRIVLAGVAVAVAVVLTPTPAAAGLLSDLLTIDVIGEGPLVSLPEAVPGAAGTGWMVVTNQGPGTGLLYLRAVDVVDDENGCNQPERAAGDTTCGAAAGELSEVLRLAVTVEPGPGLDEALSLFTGTLQQLEGGVRLDAGERPVASRGGPPEPLHIPAGGTWTLRLDYELPVAAGNETQTDEVRFELEVALGEPEGGVVISDDFLQGGSGSENGSEIGENGPGVPATPPTGIGISVAPGSVAQFPSGSDSTSWPGPDAPRNRVNATGIPRTGPAGPDSAFLVGVAGLLAALGLAALITARRRAG